MENQGIVYQHAANPFRLKLLDVSGIAVNSKEQLVFTTRTTPGRAAPVMVLDRDGNFIQGFGGQVLRNAHGICIDAEDNIYVVDPMRNCVFKFSPDGEVLSTLGEPDAPLSTSCVNYDFNTIRQAGPPFAHPAKIASGSNGDIFVVDGYGNSRIHRFAADGRLIKSWGQPGSGPGEFHIPHGIGVDPANNDVYVADRENFRIQIFDCEGNLKSIWNDIWRPTDIVVQNDRVYVGELGDMVFLDNVLFEPGGPQHKHHSRVRIFDKTGRVLAEIGTADSGAPGSFYSVHALCVDRQKNLYVGEVNFPREDLWVSYPEGAGVSASMHKALQKFSLCPA